MSSWAQSIWVVKKIKSILPTVTGTSSTEINLSDAIDIIKSLESPGIAITGSTSTETTLSDAIDILASLNNATFLQINPAEETEES